MNCYETFHEWDETLENARFAIESVTLPIFGILGFLANIIVVFALFRITGKTNLKGNHKNFDRMVISLCFIDSLLLVVYVVDALIQVDLMHEPQWYQVTKGLIRN